MNAPNWKSIGAGIGAVILGGASLIAEAPPELQKQLPQMFPEAQRGWFSLAFMAAAYLAHRYSAKHAINAAVQAALNPPVTPLVSAPLVTIKP